VPQLHPSPSPAALLRLKFSQAAAYGNCGAILRIGLPGLSHSPHIQSKFDCSMAIIQKK
jgi:hypothetical protein